MARRIEDHRVAAFAAQAVAVAAATWLLWEIADPKADAEPIEPIEADAWTPRELIRFFLQVRSRVFRFFSLIGIMTLAVAAKVLGLPIASALPPASALLLFSPYAGMRLFRHQRGDGTSGRTLPLDVFAPAVASFASSLLIATPRTLGAASRVAAPLAATQFALFNTLLAVFVQVGAGALLAQRARTAAELKTSNLAVVRASRSHLGAHFMAHALWTAAELLYEPDHVHVLGNYLGELRSLNDELAIATERDTWTLDEEIAFSERVARLHQLRKPNAANSFECSTDEGIGSRQVPIGTLLELVQNGVVHGWRRGAEGPIRVSVRLEPRDRISVVVDTPGTLAERRPGRRSGGLATLVDRLTRLGHEPEIGHVDLPHEQGVRARLSMRLPGVPS